MMSNIIANFSTLPIFAKTLLMVPVSLIAILVCLFIGGLLSGFDRVLTARLQGRKGPPILQPFYDLFKLLGKESKLASRMQIFWISLYLGLTILSFLLLVCKQDLLLIVFVMGFAGVALVMSAFSVRAPYSHMGANRELMQILAYEPVLFLFAIGYYLHNGTFMLNAQLNHEPMLFSMWPTFLAIAVIMTIKLRKSPFDLSTSHHAHQEIVKGVTTELSGEYYALFIIAEWIEILILLYIVSLFWISPIWVGFLIALAIYICEILVDNITARMTASWMIKYSWIITFILCFSNIIFLFVNKGGF